MKQNINRFFKSNSTAFLQGIMGFLPSYCLIGILQEKILPYAVQQYIILELFQYPITIIMLTSCLGWITGYIINKIWNVSNRSFVSNQIINYSILTYISSHSYLLAIYMLNFPLITLIKSSYIVCIVLINTCQSVYNNKRVSEDKVLIASIVGLGFFMFKIGDIQEKIYHFSDLVGVLMVIVSLLADISLNQCQDIIRRSYNWSQILQITNKWAFIISFVYCFIFGQFKAIAISLSNNQELIYDLLMISILGMVGQLFIYRILTHIKQNLKSVLLSFRNILSLFLSALIYNHIMSPAQYIGIMVIFFGIIYQFISVINHQRQSTSLQNVYQQQMEYQIIQAHQY